MEQGRGGQGRQRACRAFPSGRSLISLVLLPAGWPRAHASIILPVSAWRCHAMSKAVPCATLVRMIGRPALRSQPDASQTVSTRYVLGRDTWRRLRQTGRRGREPSACSVGNGPSSLNPSASPRSTAGRMIRDSSSPNRPPSPPCGLSEQTPIRGRGSADCGSVRRRW